MDEQLILKNKLKEIRAEKSLSQSELAEMVGVINTVYCPGQKIRRGVLFLMQQKIGR